MLLQLQATNGTAYRELRQHDISQSQLVMIDGNVVQNNTSKTGGTSARYFLDGYWGMAASPLQDSGNLEKQALDNAKRLRSFGQRPAIAFEGSAYQGEHLFTGETIWPVEHKIDFLNLTNRQVGIFSNRLLLWTCEPKTRLACPSVFLISRSSNQDIDFSFFWALVKKPKNRSLE